MWRSMWSDDRGKAKAYCSTSPNPFRIQHKPASSHQVLLVREDKDGRMSHQGVVNDLLWGQEW